MEKRALELTARGSRNVKIRVIEGHFVTQHSHVTHCIDMTQVKSETQAALAAAKLFAGSFTDTPVDTIITLERTKMLGAFLANELEARGINLNANVAVISPEVSDDKIILRDNLMPYVKNKRVLLLTATATTGLTLKSALEGIWYYGGTPVGAATVFGGNFGDKINMHGVIDVPVVRLFGDEAIGSYRSYLSTECPLCKNGVRIDALINSYGYSKI
ncbi:MAG: orotate phosphoribosyltransferase [Clostridia bacterium]|nr:orotate phosphoribosyltransferase [Clostridia bacterium]